MTLAKRSYWALALVALLALTGAVGVLDSVITSASVDGRAPVVLTAGNFVREVDNKFFPLSPGTTFFYEGTKDGVPVRTETYVAHETKQILGVHTTVVHDRNFENGVLEEDTLDWYAQDMAGNVWYFGEDSKLLDPDGNVISTEGSWEAGVNGARQGIIMEADPHPRDQYQQEFSAGVAEDMAQVLSLKQSACVRYGCFEDLLLTKEWTPLTPGEVDHKYYAADVGFILGVAVKGADERTELVRITTESGTDAQGTDDGSSGEAKAASGRIDDGSELLTQASITIDEAIAAAQAAASGDVGEIDLEDYNGKLAFNVDIGDKDVKVDAHTGAILSADSDD